MQHQPSPVDRLPVEVISNCLILALGDRVPALKAREAPLLFLKVSKRWRDITLSTPRLWSRVLVVADKIAPDNLEKAFSAFDAWLSRSGALPLSCYVKDYRTENLSRDRLYGIVLRYAHRLRDFHFNCTSTPIFSSGMPLFPILRSASLIFPNYVAYTGQDHTAFARTLENAPKLDSLALDVTRLVDCPGTYRQRVSKLRIVDTTYWEVALNASRTAYVLCEFPNLKVLAIDSSGGPPSDEKVNDFWPKPTIELPHLSRLYIRAEDSIFYSTVLPNILSPALEAVSIDAPLGGRDSRNALVRLFSLHTATLKTLAYHFTYPLSELRGRTRDVDSDDEQQMLDNPKAHYQPQYERFNDIWSSASSIESFTLCDHTDCSISFLECLMTLIVRFDPKDPHRVDDRWIPMRRMWDFTIQVRPIPSEWYLQRFATILHNILSSRAQLRWMASVGMLPQSILGPDLDSLRRRAKLRIVFIVQPSDLSRYVEIKSLTASSARGVPDSVDPYECIDHCTAVIKGKLQEFVSPSRPDCVNREECLDLAFGVMEEEEHMYCGEEEMEEPYDTRFMPMRTTPT